MKSETTRYPSNKDYEKSVERLRKKNKRKNHLIDSNNGVLVLAKNIHYLISEKASIEIIIKKFPSPEGRYESGNGNIETIGSWTKLSKEAKAVLFHVSKAILLYRQKTESSVDAAKTERSIELLSIVQKYFSKKDTVSSELLAQTHQLVLKPPTASDREASLTSYNEKFDASVEKSLEGSVYRATLLGTFAMMASIITVALLLSLLPIPGFVIVALGLALALTLQCALIKSFARRSAKINDDMKKVNMLAIELCEEPSNSRKNSLSIVNALGGNEQSVQYQLGAESSANQMASYSTVITPGSSQKEEQHGESSSLLASNDRSNASARNVSSFDIEAQSVSVYRR